MANNNTQKNESPSRKKYTVGGTAFRFKAKRYSEGSVVELTDEEFNRNKNRVTLIPVKA